MILDVVHVSHLKIIMGRTDLFLSFYLFISLYNFTGPGHISTAALISAQEPETSENNETSALSFLHSEEIVNDSNSELTDRQSIKLKEIRKLARLAGHEHPENITDFDNELCYKHDCLEAATEFYSSMDFSKDPCTDWGKFACEWRTLSTKSSMNQQLELALKNENQVLDILQDPGSGTERLDLAQLYYSACTNWFQDFNQISPITKYLERFGNWPLLNGGEFEGDWMKIVAEILRTAPENASPFLFKLDAVAVNGNKILLQIDTGTSYMELDGEGIRELLQILRRRLPSSPEKELDDNDDIQEIQKAMQILSVVKFDPTAMDKPALISLSTLQDKLKAQVPNLELNMVSLIQTVFGGTDLKITPETEVLINTNYISKFLVAIQSVSEKGLVNILFLQLAIILLGDTTNMLESFSNLENYKRSISGNPSHHCFMETSEIFNYALSEEYIRRHYNQENNKMVNKLIEVLKIGFINTIDSIKWLEADSQTFIKEKIKNMGSRIGFPDWITNEQLLISYYSNLKIAGNLTGEAPGNYIQYRQTALSWQNGKSWQMKLKDDNMDSWNYKQKNGFVGDAVVEYIANLNQIRIPAGVLQIPLFSIDFPGFMNFGGIGSIIAREMARAVDSKGIFINSDGDIGTWLDEKSYANYIGWSTRLQDEWENSEVKLNDKLISVIAYHITVQGYKHYLNMLTDANEKELKVPGLSSLKPEILLQIKQTNVLCEDPAIKRSQQEWENGPFSKYGMVPVTQSKHFSNLFECGMKRVNNNNGAFDFD